MNKIPVQLRCPAIALDSISGSPDRTEKFFLKAYDNLPYCILAVTLIYFASGERLVTYYG